VRSVWAYAISLFVEINKLSCLLADDLFFIDLDRVDACPSITPILEPPADHVSVCIPLNAFESIVTETWFVGLPTSLVTTCPNDEIVTFGSFR
jgi:hypothetical protein